MAPTLMPAGMSQAAAYDADIQEPMWRSPEKPGDTDADWIEYICDVLKGMLINFQQDQLPAYFAIMKLSRVEMSEKGS